MTLPGVFFCLFQLLTLPIFKFPFSLPFEYPFQDLFPLDAATLLAVAYSSAFILFEPFAGGTLAALVLYCSHLAHQATSTYGAGNAAKITGALEAASWILQFIGHGKYEGRAPAFMENFGHSFLTAPFFIWLDILFRLGYRPELRQRVEASVQKNVAAWKREKSQAAQQEQRKDL